MGLDMYLRLKEHSKCSVKGFDGDGDTYYRDPKDWVCISKEYAVCDWRKANHIHHWFVQNVQDGNDDCGEYEVKPDHLHTLRADCMFALDAYNEGGLRDTAKKDTAILPYVVLGLSSSFPSRQKNIGKYSGKAR